MQQLEPPFPMLASLVLNVGAALALLPSVKSFGTGLKY